jgi:hypothetical protein
LHAWIAQDGDDFTEGGLKDMTVLERRAVRQ